MRAIKIDVKHRTIYDITLDGSLESIYKHLECSLFECPVRFPNGDVLYVDEEGLYNETIGAFAIPDLSAQPFFLGHGLIIGDDGEGESVSAISRIEDLKPLIRVYPAFNGRIILPNLPENF